MKIKIITIKAIEDVKISITGKAVTTNRVKISTTKTNRFIHISGSIIVFYGFKQKKVCRRIKISEVMLKIVIGEVISVAMFRF